MVLIPNSLDHALGWSSTTIEVADHERLVHDVWTGEAEKIARMLWTARGDGDPADPEPRHQRGDLEAQICPARAAADRPDHQTDDERHPLRARPSRGLARAGFPFSGRCRPSPPCSPRSRPQGRHRGKAKSVAVSALPSNSHLRARPDPGEHEANCFVRLQRPEHEVVRTVSVFRLRRLMVASSNRRTEQCQRKLDKGAQPGGEQPVPAGGCPQESKPRRGGEEIFSMWRSKIGCLRLSRARTYGRVRCRKPSSESFVLRH